MVTTGDHDLRKPHDIRASMVSSTEAVEDPGTAARARRRVKRKPWTWPCAFRGELRTGEGLRLRQEAEGEVEEKWWI